MKKHWGKNISSKKIQKMSNSTNWFLLKKMVFRMKFSQFVAVFNLEKPFQMLVI